MIPALIIWLSKKYILPKLRRRKVRHTSLIIRMIILLVILFTSAYGQTQVYHIKRNDQLIGKLFFQQQNEGDNIYLKITSQVNTRLIFKIDVHTEDRAHFRNGRLISSDVLRVVNGKAKEQKRTILRNNSYQLLCGNKQDSFDRSIAYNMMMLYRVEPVYWGQVYSDNFQCFLPVHKYAAHQYRINLPDGNFNDYYFENGVCKLVILNHSLYTIKMELAS